MGSDAGARTGRAPLRSGIRVLRPQAVSPKVPSGYLAAVNYYRAQGNLPAVPADQASYKDGTTKHSHYMWYWQSLSHDEPLGGPFATVEGEDAGLESNVLLGNFAMTHGDAVTAWMTGPFHGIGILDPRLIQTGFGFWRAKGAGKNYPYTATLTVTDGEEGGWTSTPVVGTTYPIMWPDQGKTMPFDRYPGGEVPNPLAACSGYTVPTGPPIYLQASATNYIGNPGGAKTGFVSSIKKGAAGAPLAHCIYDGYMAATADPSAPSGNVMKGRDAIFLIPRNPLKSEGTYFVSIDWDGNGAPYAWSFKVADVVPPITKVTLPAPRKNYDKDKFRTIKGTAKQGPIAKVEVAIAQFFPGQQKCKWWSGSGFGSKKSCNSEKWLKATGKGTWYYKLKRELPPSAFPGTNFNYILRSRGWDTAGNVEAKFQNNRNNMAFHLLP